MKTVDQIQKRVIELDNAYQEEMRNGPSPATVRSLTDQIDLLLGDLEDKHGWSEDRVNDWVENNLSEM